MALRTAIAILVAFVATISEGQKPNDGRLSNITDHTDRGLSLQTEFSASTASAVDEDDLIGDGLCRLTTTDRYVHKKVAQMLLEDKVTLIDYQLNFSNYSNNPLTINVAGAYDAKKWSRVTTAHGQTLLSLAFNYGVLSMMTLTLGTETLHVELQDSPPGCMEAVSDRRKIDSVRRLLMRDFDADGPIMTVDDGRICNEIIEDNAGYAKFRQNCCYKNSITGNIECTTEIGNIWLNLLEAMLIIVRLGLIFLGPSLFVSAVLSMSKDSVPYVVRLKSKLEKTVAFYRADKTDLPPISAKRVLNLSSAKGFPKLQKCLRESNVQLEQPVRVRFPQYDINVDYKRMQKENVVPVGLFYSLFVSIFGCQVRFLGPFKDCCKSKMFRSSRFTITWGKFCKRLAKILLILLIPTPFYLRLVIFYVYEYDEVKRRKQAIEMGGLRESFESSLVHYFTPTHGVFIFMYLLYVVTAAALAFISQKGRDHRVKKIIINSFRELKSLNFTDTLSVVASNLVWPLKNFGALGCCVGIIYWPLAIAGSVIVCAVYLLPTLYLTFRMAYHSKLAAVIKSRTSNDVKYKVRVKPDFGMFRFQTENVLRKGRKASKEFDISLDDLDHVVPPEHMQQEVASIKSTLVPYPKFSWLRIIKYVFCAFLSILTLYAVVLIMSEVIGCLVEIVVFTIMGCIVNASALLKYVMLIIMILVYCGDCFNNMQKKYLKMNRALFNEVKFRIKDLEKVTSLPSSLQENCAFKAQELNEQADYEASDDVARKPLNHWMINDLVLFVDSEDTPRIPIQLFNDVIHIRVAGVPGPIYRGHIEAFRDLSKIVLFVVFVFLVVLSFGSVHKISATNQTLATLVGGFLPRMLRMFLAPPRPEVELGTVSFKSKMDEVIKNFCQYWPIYDLPFEVVTEEDGVQNSDAKTDTDANKNEAKLEIPRIEICRRNSVSMFDDFHDTIDGGVTERRLLPEPTEQQSLPEPNTRLEKSEEDLLSIDMEEQVDIAICLPAWSEE